MRLGFLTAFSEERVLTAKAIGFSCLELQATPGSSLDPSTVDGAAVKAILDENGIAASALACYINHLEEGKESERQQYFQGVIELAPKLGCNVVATMSGCTQQSREEYDVLKSIPAYTKYFGEIAKVAEDNNVKIAFENWPGGHPAPLLINIAICPLAWDAMFVAVPSLNLGLEYDPSHLVRLNIEYLPVIKRYAERIHHVHAKDTTIDKARLNEVGYIGQNWWRYSIPSRGVVDWSGVFSELQAIGYDGDVDIEHEDYQDFWDGKFDDGLRLGHKFLSQWVK
jgi:sugar phosphate isomerase/epimerase